MRVLYVNHTAEVGGGERSLLALLAALPREIEPVLAAPPGGLQEAARSLGVPVTTIAGTAGSLRLHPLHTPRAVAEMALAAAQVRRAAHRERAGIVHANSIRAGIVLGLSGMRRTPTVVHVRDVLPPGPLTSATMRLIAASARAVIANSRYTGDAVRAAAPSASVEVIYNPVDLERWDPERIDRADARAGLGEPLAGRLLLGVVAQLSPWKGQDTAIEALRLLRADGRDAHLLLVGSAKFLARSTRFDNERYLERLRALVADAGLEDRVSWLGEREDVPELMRALDVLLLPSWEEPFGRAVIEAMALGVPVVATDVGGPAEIITDGRDGYLLAPRDAAAWARRITELADHPELAAEIGQAGRRNVRERFTVAGHLDAVLALYARLCGGEPPVMSP